MKRFPGEALSICIVEQEVRIREAGRAGAFEPTFRPFAAVCRRPSFTVVPNLTSAYVSNFARFRGWGVKAVLVAAVLWSGRGWAQVNVEPLRGQLKEQGQAINVRVSVAGQQGNTNGVQLSSGVFYGLSGERNLFYAQVSGDYGHTNRATQIAKAFVHARYNRRIYSWLLAEVFGQWESDRFRRVQSRELFGTGPRFEVSRGDNFELVYGASYMLEVTRRTAAVEGVERSQTRHRFNNYGSFLFHVHEEVTLAETFYYQPRFDKLDDYWLLSVFSATFSVTPLLSSGLHFTVRHESNTPAPIKNTDIEVKSSLSLAF